MLPLLTCLSSSISELNWVECCTQSCSSFPGMVLFSIYSYVKQSKEEWLGSISQPLCSSNWQPKVQGNGKAKVDAITFRGPAHCMAVPSLGWGKDLLYHVSLWSSTQQGPGPWLLLHQHKIFVALHMKKPTSFQKLSSRLEHWGFIVFNSLLSVWIIALVSLPKPDAY